MESTFIQKIAYSCEKKENLYIKSKFRYIVRSILAGAFLTLSTFGGIGLADYFRAINPLLGKAAFAFIFSFGLVYILFLNAELATSNMMYLSAGVYLKKINIVMAMEILLVCIFSNLIGALITGYLMNLTSVINHLPDSNYLISIVGGKLSHSNLDILSGGILANIFVNIAIISYLLMKDSMAKIVVVISAIFIFVFLGLDHVVANFASFSIAGFSKFASEIKGFTLLNISRQWSIAFIANLIGGGMLGFIYAWLNNIDTKYKD